MRRAKLIRDGAQPCQRPWPLSKHFAVAEADAIDNKMRVDVLAVDVGGDEHLALWPSPRREHLCNLVCQLTGDRFAWSEGLHIVIKPDRTFFAVHGAGGEKFPHSKRRGTVLSTDQLLSILLHRLIRLCNICGNTAQRTGRLLCVFNKCHRCNQRCSRPASVHRPI